MISGRDALGRIMGARRDQQGGLAGMDQKLDELGHALVEVQQRRAEDLKALARVRVDLVDEHELTGALDAAERQVSALLARRDREVNALKQQIKDAQAARNALDAEREAQGDRLEEANEALDTAEAATQARLDADPDYQVQRERAREAERIAMHASEKADASEQEKDDKGVSYRTDPLFIYLWKRGYGTDEYRSHGPIRWLDGKVAGLIGYQDARVNFARLLEIPARLREHANAVAEQAEAEFAKLRALDDAARKADGIPALEQARDAEQQALTAIDDRILESEAALEALIAREARFAAGEDDYTRQAVDYLAGELAREELMDLRREAQKTPFPDDDQIVNRLLEAEQEQRRLSFTLDNLKQTRAKQQQKLDELARLERDFRRQRMDRSDSGFADGAMLAMMLTNFIDGMLDRDALMRVLEDQQRRPQRRADPTFGSGGFGRGTPWGGGGLGGLGGGFGRGGRRGGGGFRTGGGF